ncbi:MAG: hypothetical protein C0482_10355 [Gordonia sp.]|nr:hypothetical protein [Gordonia sp. (in: high G+C Gram-positive bacteria)]
MRSAEKLVVVPEGSMSRLSRRGFIGIAAAAGVLATFPAVASGATRVVRDFGAVGNGVTDDSAAIRNALAQLRSGDTLRFPSGKYRFAQRNPPGGAAMTIAGLSNITIEFEPGAELLMDNLAADGAGTSHGIVVRGPASRVTLRGVVVRWKTQPALRSMGDGIRVVGYPSTSSSVPAGWTGSKGPASYVSLLNCSVTSSPQAGVIMMGVSNPTVTGLRVTKTMADGLHFNACRRGKVSDYIATDTGDDALALVTYYSATNGFDNASQTFSLAQLGSWSDADFTISAVTVAGCRANGVRIAGANGATLTDLTIRGAQSAAGVVFDSASPGAAAGWQYAASRAIRLDRVTIENCQTGLQVLARPNGSTGDMFSRFGIDVSGLTIRACPRWSVILESLGAAASGITIRDCTATASQIASGTGIFGLATTRGVILGNITINSDAPVVAFSGDNSSLITATLIRVIVTAPANASAGPAVQFQGSDGTVKTVDVTWTAANVGWTPVRIVGRANSGCSPTNPPVKITTLRVVPTTLTRPREVTC